MISELDLNGILFCEFPDDLSLEESRERLEYDIEEYFDKYEDAEIEPVISPCSLYMTKFVRRWAELGELQPQDFRLMVSDAWKSRAEHIKPFLKQLDNKETSHA